MPPPSADQNHGEANLHSRARNVAAAARWARSRPGSDARCGGARRLLADKQPPLRDGRRAANARSSWLAALAIISSMPIASAVHSRTLALAQSLNFREWSGYY